MKKLIGVIVLLTNISNAYADNIQEAGKEEQKANSYLACSFFGSLTDPAYGKTIVVPLETIKRFQESTLNHFRKWRMLNGESDIKSDSFIIDYAEYVAGQEAVLWEKQGMDGKEIARVARQYYHESNCELLLETIK